MTRTIDCNIYRPELVYERTDRLAPVARPARERISYRNSGPWAIWRVARSGGSMASLFSEPHEAELQYPVDIGPIVAP